MEVKNYLNGIPYIEAGHRYVRFLLFNSKKELLAGPFHCKDFFNEIWYSNFESNKNCSQYGFKWNSADNIKLTPVLTFVVFKKEKDVKEVVNLHNREKIGNYLDKAFELVGIRKSVKSIRVYTDRVEVDIRKTIFKYPTISSIITYLIRTSLDAGFENIDDPKDLTNKLIVNDIVYYLQHSKFLSLLENKTYFNNIKKVRWKHFSSTKEGPYLYSKISPGTGIISKPTHPHNRSGFITFMQMVEHKVLTEFIK